MQKRKRDTQDEARDLQASLNHQPHMYVIPPQRKRSRTAHTAHQLPPPLAISSSNTKPMTNRKAGSLRRSMRSRGRAMLDTSAGLQTAGQTQAYGGKSDAVDHSGLRRSARIQERRGTDKRTVYDGSVRVLKPSPRKAAQQKREAYSKRSNAGSGPQLVGELSGRKGQKGRHRPR